MNQVFLEQLGLWGPMLMEKLGAGKTFFVDPSNGAATGGGLTPLEACSVLTTIKAKLTTGQNDQIKLIAGGTSNNLSAALTWALNCSHLRGEGSFGRMNQRSRIGHSANFTPMLTVSGYGNSFQDLYFMHGRGNAGNLVGLDITGARNSFLRCHIGGPMHATEAGTANYRLIKLENSETFFKDCVIGVDTVPLTAAISLMEFGAQADPPRLIVEDTLFICAVNAAGGAGATFLKVLAGCGEGLALFRNCQFVNIGSQAMTVGIDGAGLGNFKMVFDSRCAFFGCTDVVADAYAGSVLFVPANTAINQVTGGASVALFNGLGVAADAS